MTNNYEITEADNAGYAKALEMLKPDLTAPPHFLNAPFYGKWQELAGKEVLYFIISSDSEVAGCGLAVRLNLPRSYSFYYCPYGPLVSKWSAGLTTALEEFFVSLGRKKILFARVDADNLPSGLIKPASAAAAATAALQPRNEWLLDISESEENLFKNMHQKARYPIRQSQKAGATFRVEKCSTNQLDKFYKLLQTTASRDNFHLQPKANYRAAFEAASEHAFIGYADIDDMAAAASFCVIYEGVCHYIYGASGNQFLKVGPGYFLQWHCILEAKKRDATLYNFGGIAGGVKGEKLAGVTQFKQRFGGYTISHKLPSDIVINPLGYRLFTSYKKLQRH